MNTTVKAIIFDFGGVIGQPQNQDRLVEMAATFGLSASDFSPAYLGYRRDYDAGIVDGVTYWKSIFDHFKKEHDLVVIDRLIKLDIAAWTEKNHETIDLIGELKKSGLKLYLLSNMPPEYLAVLNSEFECLTHFDHCFYSSKITMTKPDAEIYQHCLKEIDLKPEECIFIDDSAKNVAGAIACGIPTIHFKNTPELKKALAAILYV